MTGQPASDPHTADQWRHHLRELAAITKAFHAGTITVHRKRQLIAAENARYHGPGHKGSTGADITTSGKKPTP